MRACLGIGVALALSLLCARAEAQVVVNAVAINFGKTVGCSAPFVLTITNKSGAPVNILGYLLGGSDPNDFLHDGVAPLTLLDGKSVDVDVWFAGVGQRQAQLRITTDDPKTASITIPLQGSGMAAGAPVVPASLTFDVNQPNPQTVTITNYHCNSFTVTRATFAGPQGDWFRFAQAPPLPRQLGAGGGSLQLQVQFVPPSGGQAQGTLTLVTDDPQAPTLVIPLAGSSVGAKAVVTPNPLEFGAVAVGSQAGRSVQLCNQGQFGLEIDGASVLDATGAFSDSLDNDLQNLPFVVEPGACKSVGALFLPAEAKDYAAALELDLRGDPDAMHVRVALHGRGTVPVLTAVPTTLDFSTVATGAPLATTITNVGELELDVRRTVTAPSGVFDFGSALHTSHLQPGESWALEATCAPGAQVVAGTLTVSSTPAGTPAVVSLLCPAILLPRDMAPASGCSCRVAAGGAAAAPGPSIAPLALLLAAIAGLRGRRR